MVVYWTVFYRCTFISQRPRYQRSSENLPSFTLEVVSKAFAAFKTGMGKIKTYERLTLLRLISFYVNYASENLSYDKTGLQVFSHK